MARAPSKPAAKGATPRKRTPRQPVAAPLLPTSLVAPAYAVSTTPVTSPIVPVSNLAPVTASNSDNLWRASKR